MMKNILLILGHPNGESYCRALFDTYEQAAIEAGFIVKTLILAELEFNPDLSTGYKPLPPLEPDLKRAQDLILWADHLVWIYPLWWGSVPALLKGFLDRIFIPNFAFDEDERGKRRKLLKGKSARMITTMGMPPWFYTLVYGQPSHMAMKWITFFFSGIWPVKITSIGPMKKAPEHKRKKWIAKIERLGTKGI